MAQAIILSVTMLLVLAGFTRWLPGRPRGLSDVRSFIGFGSQLLSVQVLSYVSSNLDKILIGRMFGAKALGLYSKAFVLYSQPLAQALAPFTNLAVSSLSQVRDEPQIYLSRLLRLQQVTTYIGLGGFALMIGTAGPLTTVVLGPAWAGTVPLFRILCVGGLFQILGFVYYWLFLSTGTLRTYLVCTFVTQPIAIALVALGTLHGVTGVAWGATAGLIVEWAVPATWGASKAIGQARALLSNSIKPLVLAACVGVAAAAGVMLTEPWNAALQLIIGIGAAAAAVGLVALCIPPVRRDLAHILQIAGAALGRRRRPTGRHRQTSARS